MSARHIKATMENAARVMASEPGASRYQHRATNRRIKCSFLNFAADALT